MAKTQKLSLKIIKKYKPELKAIPKQGVDYEEIDMNGIIEEDAILVYIEDKILNKMVSHSKSDLYNEIGGALLGQYCRSNGQSFVIISRIIPCIENSPMHSHMTFPPEFWIRVDNELEQKYPSLIPIGTYHSHPGIGVFLSSVDRRTIETVFNNPYHVTIIVEPTLESLSPFVWRKNIIKRTGFYILKN